MNRDISLNEYDVSLLQGGALNKYASRLGLGMGAGPNSLGRRAFLLIGATYVPLFVLSMIQGNLINSSLQMSFLQDFAQVVRYIVVLPLLILAELAIAPWMSHMTQHLRKLVPDESQSRFDQFINRAVEGRDSLIVELILLAIAFIRNAFIPTTGIAAESQTWEMHPVGNGLYEYTWAFYWANFFAKPIFIFIWLRWLWRYVLWSAFLVRVSTINLKLRPTHPDRLGGLGFLAIGQAKFGILCFAMSLMLSSRIAESIFYMHASLLDFRSFIFLMVIVNIVVFSLPLFAFTPKLMDCKRQGLFEYGELANKLTDDFHERWIHGSRAEHEELVKTGEISSLADLGGAFDIVQQMKAIIVSKDMLFAFVIATIAPFAPLLLTVYPIDVFVGKIWSTLF